MTNKGFELTLSGDVIRNNDWNWNVSGVLGYNKNKVTYVVRPELRKYMTQKENYIQI